MQKKKSRFRISRPTATLVSGRKKKKLLNKKKTQSTNSLSSLVANIPTCSESSPRECFNHFSNFSAKAADVENACVVIF